MDNKFIIIIIIAIILVIVAIIYRKTYYGNKVSNDMQVTKENKSALLAESLVFNLEETSSQNADNRIVKTYDANYAKQGKVARFRIKITLQEPMETEKDSDFKIAFTDGSFYRVENSDSEYFFRDLVKVLEAKKIPLKSKRETKIDFRTALFGLTMSPRTDDQYGTAKYFTDEPKGDWIVSKIFLGENDAEVFMYLNTKEGIGHFSLKDSDYGDGIIQELMKVI